jgi:DNA-binding SARP family transcriptional activator
VARVEIALLGGFAVTVDGRTVGDEEWTRRPATSLVKLLALAPARRAHREQVMDALWPDVAVEAAAPRLHKAAHYARKGLGDRDRLVVRADIVALCPADDVLVDAQRFERAAQVALTADAPANAVQDALAMYGGELLPQDMYEPWTEQARSHVSALYTSLLRAAGRWGDLVALDPSDEVAQVSLMRSHAEAGDRAAALRQFERLERALRHELGVAPGREAQCCVPSCSPTTRRRLPLQPGGRGRNAW